VELIRGIHNLRPRHRGCVATIGNYDGVHLGHQAVLQALAQESLRFEVPSLVMTFEPTSREFFTPESAPPRIQALLERAGDLWRYGAGRVLCVRFDRRFASIEAERFIDEILVAGLGVRYVVVGDDFRFGAKRRGDFAMLAQAGQRKGFEVTHLPTVLQDGERVSSSRVRAALAAGDMALAQRLMGRPYRVAGRVVGGRRLGRSLGVPTANLPMRRRRAIRQGIYVAEVDLDSAQAIPAVISIGVRPTISPGECVLEAHLLDFDQDLYGKRIEVRPLKYLRPEAKFESLDALREQMTDDIRQARSHFGLRLATAI
jgi:riboflavin kinase / FMN adenylyltransferase